MMIRPDTGSPDERRLLRTFRSLDDGDRQALLAFAAFLRSRAESPAGAGAQEPTISMEPVAETRPEQETVVAAIKRLRRVYPMVDASKMLNETSTLMSAHVIQGRPATDVINELEALFEARWAALRDGSS